MEIRGDLNVGRLITAGRRVNEGAIPETSSSITLDQYSHHLLIMNVASAGTVDLPNAATIPLGWQVFVVVREASQNVEVRTYDAATPALLKQIIAGRAYEFTLIDQLPTGAGTWLINYVEEADLVPSERFVVTFDSEIVATGDWSAASGGYHTITVTEATHGRGAYPIMQLFKIESSDKIYVMPDRVLVNSAGDITFRVPTTPDLKFAGHIVII